MMNKVVCVWSLYLMNLQLATSFWSSMITLTDCADTDLAVYL